MDTKQQLFHRIQLNEKSILRLETSKFQRHHPSITLAEVKKYWHTDNLSRAGHATTLPRQPDYVFNCWLLHCVSIRCDYSI